MVSGKFDEDLMDQIVRALEPMKRWSKQCHAASVHVKAVAGLPEPVRVARGWCEGIGGQHSWLILSDDVCDEEAWIVDPTLWSYQPFWGGEPGGTDWFVWTGTMAKDGLHRPHGMYGDIMQHGRPPNVSETGEDKIVLDAELSDAAELFLSVIGPMGRKGWSILFNGTMQGWPAREIVRAAAEDDRLSSLIPIDIVGMLTDQNPAGLYA